MSMTLSVPTDIAEAVRDAADRAGDAPEHVMIEVLRAHFPPIPDALRQEFTALERASDEDFLGLEHGLGDG